MNAWAASIPVVALLAYVGTWLARRYALAHQLLDVPNERSLHHSPTPRGGGLAIAAATLGAFAAAGLLGWLPPRTSLALTLGGAAVAAVGWMDDRVGVRPRARAFVHFAAAAGAVWLLGGFPSADLGFGAVRLGPLGSVVAVLGIVWAVNFYNFMDGIDGLAGVEAATVGIAGAILLRMGGAPALSWAASVVAAAALGFLVWNWAPARIFMGDAGSGLLGYCFGVFTVASQNAGAVPAALWGLLLGVFVVDATVTLVRRLVRGERPHQAHREHAYQRLVRAGLSHRAVCVAVLAVNAILAGFAVLAVRRPALLPGAVAGGALFLALVYYGVERFAPRRGNYDIS